MPNKDDEPEIVEPNPVKTFFWATIWVSAIVMAYYRNGKVLNLYMIPAALFSQLYIIVAIGYFFVKENGFTQIKQYTAKKSN